MEKQSEFYLNFIVMLTTNVTSLHRTVVTQEGMHPSKTAWAFSSVHLGSEPDAISDYLRHLEDIPRPH